MTEPATRHRPRGILLFAVLLAMAASHAAAVPAAARCRVLLSQDVDAYREALGGLKQVLQREVPGASVEVEELHGDAAAAAAAVSQARTDGVSLVVAFGSLAAQQAARELTDIPIVAGLVLNASELGRNPNVTGVVLEFPVETEIKWIQRFLGDSRRIGVLLSPSGNEERVRAAEKVAQAAGLSIQTRRVESPRDLPASLASLEGKADVLWGMTDPVVLNPQTAKPVLLFSLRNRIPFIGLSATWVKAGALYALDRDYADIGAQCGEVAVQVLSGHSPASLPLAPPRKLIYSVNLRTARELKISLDKKLLQGARDVVE